MLIKNDIFLRAMAGDVVPRMPVWLMRQAGRYLPEYRATRARAGGFMALMQNANFATEVTLQPIDRFGFDAAILFSDILTIPHAMGLQLSFAEGEGPRFARPLVEESDFKALKIPASDAWRYVLDAVSQIHRALAGRVPLIGFAGSPFTLACYMVDGQGGKGFPKTHALVHKRPDLFQRLIDINTDAIIHYLNDQIARGVEAIMLFDSWGGSVDAETFSEIIQPSFQRIFESLTGEADGRKIPRILFAKGAGDRIGSLSTLPLEGLGLDSTTCLQQAVFRTERFITLQGAIDPLALLGDENRLVSRIQNAVRATQRAWRARRLGPFATTPFPEGFGGHVFNVGHGLLPETPPENVALLVETLRGLSPSDL